MDTFISRLPSTTDVSAWTFRHRGKLGGFLSGSVGMWVVATFLVVAITGVPHGGERLSPDRTIVYPNF
ncbi:hypothetical protein L0664_05185 [Octadecabacter sp. G9-8]|uniref:Uncharacterized protein n=1 Tax=Octadecabacter dasysiphoniae TaxID=2909341 RepID=A0ABS9CTB3_9RHOB|nr:hypothetical protein [Octadecabacter dasysiphoniae]MCF2870454.1 hypothetical protein [Octadecabacter dasysiphoniae]